MTTTSSRPGATEPHTSAAPYRRLLVLTAVAAATDAVSYLGLGHVFTANMTGNTVLLATGLTAGSADGAAHSAAALGGFVVGAGLAGASAGAKRWDRVTSVWLMADAALLIAAATWWAVLGTAQPHGAAQFGLTSLVSTAMGVQSAAVSHLDVGVSTTYITGTWTSVSAWATQIVGGRRPVSAGKNRIQAAVLVCYFGAALVAGLIYHATTT